MRAVETGSIECDRRSEAAAQCYERRSRLVAGAFIDLTDNHFAWNDNAICFNGRFGFTWTSTSDDDRYLQALKSLGVAYDKHV